MSQMLSSCIIIIIRQHNYTHKKWTNEANKKINENREKKMCMQFALGQCAHGNGCVIYMMVIKYGAVLYALSLCVWCVSNAIPIFNGGAWVLTV